MPSHHHSAGRPCCRTLLPALHCDDVYYLPDGMPGFAKIRGFSVHCVLDIQPLFFVRSLDPHSLSFVCIDPFLVYPAYEPQVGAKDLHDLELQGEHEAIFISLVDMKTDAGQITANLRGPLVLNRQRRLAKQVDCAHPDYPLRYPIGHAIRPLRVPNPSGSSAVEPFTTGPACTHCRSGAAA